MSEQEPQSEPSAITPIIEEAVRRLVDAAQPLQIILFGSQARGDATAESDLDVLVILPHIASRHHDAVRLGRVLHGLGAPVDLLVYSQAEADDRGHIWGTALYEALREGVTLYDSARGGGPLTI